jgi:hypothetical protein
MDRDHSRENRKRFGPGAPPEDIRPNEMTARFALLRRL